MRCGALAGQVREVVVTVWPEQRESTLCFLPIKLLPVGIPPPLLLHPVLEEVGGSEGLWREGGEEGGNKIMLKLVWELLLLLFFLLTFFNLNIFDFLLVFFAYDLFSSSSNHNSSSGAGSRTGVIGLITFTPPGKVAAAAAVVIG